MCSASVRCRLRRPPHSHLSPSVTDRIEQIEFRIAFLEQANTQLGDTVFQQQQELKALRAQLATLLQRFEAEQSQQPTAWTAQDEKPPHY